jgi:hypothetical protein
MWIVTANQKNDVPTGSVHCRRMHRPADEDFAFGSPWDYVRAGFDVSRLTSIISGFAFGFGALSARL